MRIALCTFLLAAPAIAQTPITLSVDLRDAPRKILHATETIPVTPGPQTLATPNGANFTAGGSTSANLAVLSWNTLVLYPYSGPAMNAASVMITPSLTLPADWKYGTALDPTSGAGTAQIGFRTVSLEQLVDSPVLAGRFFREVPLAPEVTRSTSRGTMAAITSSSRSRTR
jgi:hypothetical protein